MRAPRHQDHRQELTPTSHSHLTMTRWVRARRLATYRSRQGPC